MGPAAPPLTYRRAARSGVVGLVTGGRCKWAHRVIGSNDLWVDTIRVDFRSEPTVGSGGPARDASGRSGRARARGRGERGEALLEFSICLPVLALLVFGVIDLGRVFVMRESLQNAAHEAAVWASAHPGQQLDASQGGCAAPASAVWRGQNEGKGSAAFTFTFSPAVAGCTTDPAQVTSLPPGAPLRVRASSKIHMLTPFFPSSLTVGGSVCVSISGAKPSGAPCP